VSFGVSYGETSEFGSDVTYSIARGQVISFDDRPPLMRSGNTKVVYGNVMITEDYYPWVNEEYVGRYAKSVWLAGKGARYNNYRAHQARQVQVEVMLHSEYPVYSKGPRTQLEGNRTIFTYSDGASRPENPVRPSFRKLESIRLGLSSEYEKYNKQ
jgi:hypothetical protein